MLGLPKSLMKFFHKIKRGKKGKDRREKQKGRKGERKKEW